MTAPNIVAIQLTEADQTKPLLLVGPGLGTGVEALWTLCANELAADFEVIGYDLPGHGLSLIHISEPTRLRQLSRMPSSA